MTSVISYFKTHGLQYLMLVLQHLRISLLTVLVASLIAIPLGVLAGRSRIVERVTLRVMSTLRVIPSLAVLFICVPILGTGLLPALIALLLLAIPPILINTIQGFQGVDQSVKESAIGMGMDEKMLFRKIEMPLALPVIFSGIRIAMVEVIASATLASYIGGGGLGDLIFTGLGLMRTDLLWIGGLSVALLSLGIGVLMSCIDRRLRYYERGR